MKALLGYGRVMQRLVRNSGSDDLEKFAINDVFLGKVWKQRNKETVTEYLFKDSYNILYYQTPTRPTDFTTHASIKTLPHNWFDDNRLYNETLKNYYHSRVTIHSIIQGAAISLLLIIPIIIKRVKAHILAKEPILDTYTEIMVGDLPTGQAMIADWKGTPIFVRRLNMSELNETNKIPLTEYCEPLGGYMSVTDDGNTVLAVLKPAEGTAYDYKCYSGKYGGWVNTKTGAEYNKIGQAIGGSGKRTHTNFEAVPHQLYGGKICVEKQTKDYEESVLLA
jgi:hypothetical protein